MFHRVGLKDEDSVLGIFVCLFLAAPHSVGILFSKLRTEPGPLQWKLGVLTAGQPGKCSKWLYFNRIPWDDITGIGFLFSLRGVLEEI